MEELESPSCLPQSRTFEKTCRDRGVRILWESNLRFSSASLKFTTLLEPVSRHSHKPPTGPGAPVFHCPPGVREGRMAARLSPSHGGSQRRLGCFCLHHGSGNPVLEPLLETMGLGSWLRTRAESLRPLVLLPPPCPAPVWPATASLASGLSMECCHGSMPFPPAFPMRRCSSWWFSALGRTWSTGRAAAPSHPTAKPIWPGTANTCLVRVSKMVPGTTKPS